MSDLKFNDLALTGILSGLGVVVVLAGMWKLILALADALPLSVIVASLIVIGCAAGLYFLIRDDRAQNRRLEEQLPIEARESYTRRHS